MNAILETDMKKISGGKFLTFFLGGEEYGIEILKVREIIGVMPITPVPRTPKYIHGVINLRGKIIPVISLRAKFEMTEVDKTNETCIIVVQAQGIEMGVIVDRVSEVADISSESIESTPSFGENINTDYILGIGKSNDKVKLLLDINKILSAQDLANISTMQNNKKEVVNAQLSAVA